MPAKRLLSIHPSNHFLYLLHPIQGCLGLEHIGSPVYCRVNTETKTNTGQTTTHTHIDTEGTLKITSEANMHVFVKNF